MQGLRAAEVLALNPEDVLLSEPLWIAKIPPGREMRLSIGPGDRFGRRFPFGTARCVTAEGTKRALRHTSLAIHLQLRREILATTTQAATS